MMDQDDGVFIVERYVYCTKVHLRYSCTLCYKHASIHSFHMSCTAGWIVVCKLCIAGYSGHCLDTPLGCSECTIV